MKKNKLFKIIISILLIISLSCNALLIYKVLINPEIPTTNNFRYDINTHTHAHLTCKECGSVIDLYDGDYQKIVSNLESKYNVKIDDTNLIFNGLCEDCNGKI